MKRAILLAAATLLAYTAVFAEEPNLKESTGQPALTIPDYGGGRGGSHDGDGPQNVIKFNPLALVFSRFSFAYELALNESMAIEMQASYTNLLLGDDVSGKFAIKGFRIAPHYKYYITHGNKPAPKGFYVAPFLEYNSYTVSVSQINGSSTATGSFSATLFGGGANLGYQWLIANVVAVDMYAGVSYDVGGASGDIELKNSSGAVVDKVSAPSTTGAGLIPNFGFAVGFAF